jgi:two-component system copper resistance phosphate regulon response regulator CusR
MRILLVEDEKKVASFIRKGLMEQSYVVDVAEDGLEGEKLACANEYDAVVLDVMLPRKSGFAVCRSIRMVNAQVPIIMLTALDSTDDKLQGLDAGADDYLAKPFEFRELLARLRAQFRKRHNHNAPALLEFVDLRVDLATRVVTRSGQSIVLTSKEFALLEYLLRNRKRVVARTELAEHVWDSCFDSESNVIDVYVSLLRRKIDRDFSHKLIHTVIGVGYVLREDEAEHSQ